VPDGVLSQLPDQKTLAQSVRRSRRRDHPPNPTSLSALCALPDRYKVTLLNENFLLYDSGSPDNEVSRSEDEESDSAGESEHAEAAHRVIVFATRRNIEFLCESPTWFLDGTFSTSPNLFVQIFTILGIRTRTG